MTAQEDTEAHPAKPHGQAGNDHGKFHITCCPKAIGRNKGCGPDDGFHDRDPGNHMEAEARTLRLHAAQRRDGLCEQENCSAADDDDYSSNGKRTERNDRRRHDGLQKGSD